MQGMTTYPKYICPSLRYTPRYLLCRAIAARLGRRHLRQRRRRRRRSGRGCPHGFNWWMERRRAVGRAGGGDRPAGRRRAGGCAASGTAAAARADGVVIMIHNSEEGADVVEDNGYTCDVSLSTNANVYFHHK